jgi:uncharacterized membrane protein
VVLLLATGQFVQPGTISGRTWVFLVMSGLGTGGSWLCYFRALKLGPASLVAPVDKLSVALVAIFGALVLGERPSAAGWFGTNCGLKSLIMLSPKTYTLPDSCTAAKASLFVPHRRPVVSDPSR